jgi:hypothetical protein
MQREGAVEEAGTVDAVCLNNLQQVKRHHQRRVKWYGHPLAVATLPSARPRLRH